MMRCPTVRQAGLLTAMILALIAGPVTDATADPPEDGGIVVAPDDPFGRSGPPKVDVDVSTPGSPGTPPGDGRNRASSGGGTRGPVCVLVPDPEMEQWSRRLPSTFDPPGQDQVDPNTHLFARVCDGVMDGFVWLGPGEAPNPAAAALPSPGELARRAAGQLVLPLPVPRHSPDVRLDDGTSAVVVGEHTWIWMDPAGWGPQRKRVQAGPVWAEVTATPVRLAFTPGDGNTTVMCAGPGGAYTPSAGVHAASPTCDYVYQRSSAGMPGGTVTATYAVGWQVTWRGATGTAPAGGALPEMTSQASATFAVAEAQGLIVR